MTETMSQMSRPTLIHIEVTHLSVNPIMVTEIVAVVAVKKDLLALMEAHQDIPTMGEMAVMAVTMNRTIPTIVMARVDTPTII